MIYQMLMYENGIEREVGWKGERKRKCGRMRGREGRREEKSQGEK